MKITSIREINYMTETVPSSYNFFYLFFLIVVSFIIFLNILLLGEVDAFRSPCNLTASITKQSTIIYKQPAYKYIHVLL